MEKGYRYHVVFRLDNQKRLREMVADYLGDNERGEHQFSLRPHAGTTALESRHITSKRRTTEAVYVPRMVK